MCFFALLLPQYSSFEILKARLLYAISSCREIDSDFNPNGENILLEASDSDDDLTSLSYSVSEFGGEDL